MLHILTSLVPSGNRYNFRRSRAFTNLLRELRQGVCVSCPVSADTVLAHVVTPRAVVSWTNLLDKFTTLDYFMALLGKDLLTRVVLPRRGPTRVEI